MYFKVNYDKLGEISKTVTTKTDEINDLYMDIVDICKKINDNWHSEDSSVYISNFVKFLAERIKEDEVLYSTGATLGVVAGRYSEQDAKWKEEVIKSDITKGSL